MPTPKMTPEELGRRMDAIQSHLRQGLSLNKACRAAAEELGLKYDAIKSNYVEHKRGGFADCLSVFVPQVNEIPLADAIADLLSRGRPVPAAVLADKCDVSTKDVARAVEELKANSLNIAMRDGAYTLIRSMQSSHVHGPVVEIFSDDNDQFRIGALGDSHLCSKYERLDVLQDLYRIYAEEGVDSVFHTGNWIDGEARFNMFDIHQHGMQNQVDYLAREYPQRAGIKTYAVAGDDHEGWYNQKTGIDIGGLALSAFKKAGREDWFDLGYMSALVKLTNKRSGVSSIMNVMHPGGGSAYAISYTAQKIVESFEGGEKPAVLLIGHYHKMECANVRNVWTLQTGCTQDQTPFMMKKRLEAHVGGVLVSMTQDPKTGAIIGFRPDMRRYFNQGYYNGRWSHSATVTQPERKMNQTNSKQNRS